MKHLAQTLILTLLVLIPTNIQAREGSGRWDKKSEIKYALKLINNLKSEHQERLQNYLHSIQKSLPL